ncbi:MAG: hypothetical protein B1H08_02775 [Candidatus Omnitrophica bacterium 4484_171]|nr:MAG: hypothetical protein B1H08_02775 [Candidatus Omnitrophica bacterium 4484_171]
MSVKVKVSEVFKSIQGEGIYAGSEQVFVRFFGCNLNCVFCDTKPDSFKEMDIDSVISEIGIYRDCRFISITGGEPLLQKGALKELLLKLKKEGKTIYLETNGVLYEALGEVIQYIDIIAMDFKLPSSTQDKDCSESHKLFLQIASDKDVFVKAVITPSTNTGDVMNAVRIIKGVSAYIPFVLQPVHPREKELTDKLAKLSVKAKDYLYDVRIIPQLHKIIGVR